MDTSEQHRTFLTVKSLAERLGLDVQHVHDRNDVGGLSDAVLSSGPVTVICWEHDALVAWLQRFAGKVDVTPASGEDPWLPCTWEHGRFDVLWQLRLLDSDGGPAFEFSVRDQGLAGEEVPPPE